MASLPMPYNVRVDAKYGAPMGRSDAGVCEEGQKLIMRFVPLPDGYDGGGAYWGLNSPGAFLWCAYNADRSIVRYGRSKNIQAAKSDLEEFEGFPLNLSWYGESGRPDSWAK